MSRSPDAVTYRRARVEDAERTFVIVRTAADDLLVRNGRVPTGGAGLPPERVIRFRHTCVAHDPDRFWVAEADGVIVGAGFAVLRESAWYLGGLHVLPGWQGRGIGREILRRTLTGVPPDAIRSVLTDTLNPDSNGLYLAHGLLPHDSTLTFDGPIGRRPVPTATDLEARPLDAMRDAKALEALDRATVGFARPVDHGFWGGVPGLSARSLVGSGGEIRGYLYVSAGGAVGPIAVHDPADVAGALDLATALAADAGASALHLRAFGSGHPAIRWALARGLRLTGTGLLLGTAPIGRFAGYVTSGADALY